MAGYAIVITATDKVTGVLDRVNDRVLALNKRINEARAPFERLSDSFSKFSQTTGLDRIATGFKNSARGALDMFNNLMRVIEPLAAITGAASLAGVYRLSEAWGNMGLKLQLSAQRSNLTTDAMQNLQNAARLAGVPVEATASSMGTLADNLRDSQFHAGTFTQAINSIGLSTDRLRKMNPVDQVKAISDALARFNPQDKALLNREIFGGEQMLPFLQRLSGGITGLMTQADKYGHVSAQQLKQADEFRQANSALGISVDNLGYAIAGLLGPVMTPLIGDLASAIGAMGLWIDANHTWLQQAIATEIGKVVTWLKAIDWHQVGVDVLSIAHGADTVAGAMGGWKMVGLEVMGFFVGKWLVGMLFPFLRITAAVLGLKTELAAMSATGTGGLSGIVGQLGAVAAQLGLAYAAWKGLDVASTATDDGSNGLRNLIRNVILEPVEHWSPTYHAGGDQAEKGWGAAYSGSDASQGGGNARNMRDNNPTNLMFAGQKNASQEGPFAKFPNMETGVAADLNQLLLYQDRDHLTSIQDMIHKASPPGPDNPHVESYIDKVAATLHVKRTDSVDLHDPLTATKYIMAVAGQEGGTPDKMAVARGVGLRLGVLPTGMDSVADAPAAVAGRRDLDTTGETAPLPQGAAGAPGATGKVDMNIRVDGQPAKVTTRAQGDINLANNGLLGF